MNANTIKGLELISEGINLILEGANETVTEIAENVKKSAEKTTKKESAPATSREITEEELEGMSYNDLKKLAAEMGVSPKGNRKELVARLLNSDEAPEEEEEKPTKKSAPKKTAKTQKVGEPDEDEDEEDEIEDESDDSDEEDISAQVEAAVEDMTDDEIRELLESVDIPTKGKRQALITKLIHAVEDGLIDLDDEDDEDEESEDEDDETEIEDTEESNESDESEDEDDEEDSVTANMTKKRRKAYDDMCDETSEGFESGEITREDLISFISEFTGTDAKKMKKTSDEDLLTQYLTIAANFIDDDGEQVEEGAYYINEEPYCCGRPLKYNKKKKQYVCETCGAEYDDED